MIDPTQSTVGGVAVSRPVASSFDLGGMFRGVSQIAKLIHPFLPQPPDPIAELQARILSVELAKKLAGGTIPYGISSWAAVAPDRRSDHILIGARGAGKTAFASLLAQHMRDLLKVPVFAPGFPQFVSDALGFHPSSATTAREWLQAQDCILLLDEARLRVKDVDLWELVALARQRNVSIIYTTQSLAALPRDILRLEAVLWARRLDPLASRFEREEVADLAAQCIAVQSAVGFTVERPSLVLKLTAPAVVCETPLPVGWSDEASTLWRKR